jgi:hypothetical protein
MVIPAMFEGYPIGRVTYYRVGLNLRQQFPTVAEV